MAFASEFVQYLFKFIVLGIIAIAGVGCGIQIRKKKTAKDASVEGATTTEE